MESVHGSKRGLVDKCIWAFKITVESRDEIWRLHIVLTMSNFIEREEGFLNYQNQTGRERKQVLGVGLVSENYLSYSPSSPLSLAKLCQAKVQDPHQYSIQ